MQCHGNKRWRLAAAAPDRRPGADPLARGKGDDVLELGELEETPAADVVLTLATALVPAGWPHTTDTLECAVDDEPSVHLTLGVDTHIWGSTASALARRRAQDDALAGRRRGPGPLLGSLRKDLPALGWRGGDADDAARVAAFVARRTAPREGDAAATSPPALAHGAEIAAAIRGLYADVFAVGDAVLAPYLGTDDYEEAVVDNVRVDGRLDVVFLDGDFEQGLDPAVVTPKKKKKKAKTVGGAAPAKKKKKAITRLVLVRLDFGESPLLPL
ncbi:histone demethylase [Aureococcus anophagefferens]|nr:histone demethylase [Aureococcus anophagefferens]